MSTNCLCPIGLSQIYYLSKSIKRFLFQSFLWALFYGLSIILWFSSAHILNWFSYIILVLYQFFYFITSLTIKTKEGKWDSPHPTQANAKPSTSRTELFPKFLAGGALITSKLLLDPDPFLPPWLFFLKNSFDFFLRQLCGPGPGQAVCHSALCGSWTIQFTTTILSAT